MIDTIRDVRLYKISTTAYVLRILHNSKKLTDLQFSSEEAIQKFLGLCNIYVKKPLEEPKL